VGDGLPSISLESSQGVKVDLGALKGKVIYVDVWASWCGPCRKSLPWMKEIKQRYESKGFDIVAVNVDSNKKDAEAFLGSLNPNFQVLFDPQGSFPEQCKVESMPSSFLIGKDGKVISIFPGFHPGDDQKIEAKIKEVVGVG